MRRTVTIAFCLALLSLATLIIWVYVQRTGQGGAPAPEANISTGQEDNTSPGRPIEKTAVAPRVFQLSMYLAFFGDDWFSPCYFDRGTKTLYRWKGVVLRREQLPNIYRGPISAMPVLNAKDFTVVPIEALVKYRELNGGYRPGYLDRSNWVFYEWKGVVLSKQELLEKSQDGQDAIVKPLASGRMPQIPISQVIEIPLPAHLKEQPALWKKGGAYTPEASIRAEERAAEKRAAEKRALDPRVFELPVRNAYFGDDQFSPCYMDLENKTLYRWKGVVLRREQMQQMPFARGPSGIRMPDPKTFTVAPVEAPVKYRETDGDYRPGYLDRVLRVFYEWKGIVLRQQEVLDKSQDGKAAIVTPDSFSQVIEIDMPAHLKEQLALWKKGGAYTPEASIRAEKRAAEKRAAEKRALDPRVFQLLVRLTAFGENEYSPCYYDPQNHSFYRWKGVVLRQEQVPEAYKPRAAPPIVLPNGKTPSTDALIERQRAMRPKIQMLNARAVSFWVVPVEAPVSYREVNGGYRPGYLERDSRVFYEWKGVVLSKQEVPDKSRDGQDAVVKPTAFDQVIEIDMPAHLKEQPGLWKKT